MFSFCIGKDQFYLPSSLTQDPLIPNTAFLPGSKLIDSSKFLKNPANKSKRDLSQEESSFLSCITVAALSLLISNRYVHKISFKLIQ